MTVFEPREVLESPSRDADTDAAGGLGSKKGSRGDKEPMPLDVWGKIYGMRNGQLVLLYALDDDGFKKMREQGQGSSVLSNDLDKKTHKYTTTRGGYSDKTYAVDSWGAFVEYAARVKLDLTGLTLSPDQKKYRYEFELQNRQLSEGKLDFANLENMDITGTDFTGATMQQASLKNTSGKKPAFAKVKGYQADFSGSTYTEPDFSSMTAPRSVHFGSTYNLPVFGDTDWNSAHIVGSRFFLRHDNNGSYGARSASLNVSSGLLAGCLFYGMDTDPMASPLRFSQAAFPGSCFYNLNLTPGEECRKADFSPLLLQDPRLSAPEQEFMRTFGQWLNSEKAMDGVKVSPEVNVPLDDSRIYTMFSEVRFDEDNYKAPLFFSKGQVLNRSSFHECEVVDIAKILPKNMAERLAVVDAPVIQQVEPETAAPVPAPVSESNALPIPTIAFDRDEIALQVQTLKTASIADTLSIGGKLQTALIDTTRLVSGWAMNHLGRQSLRDDVEKLSASIKAASMSELFAPAPSPAPLAEPPPAPRRKSAWREFFSLSAPEESVMAPSLPEAPPPPDRFGVINEEMAAFPHSLGSSIDVNKEDVANAEKVKKFLQTMQDAFTAYIGELQALAPELKEKNPDVLPYAEMRRKSLEESRNLVAKLNESMGEFVRTTASDGAIYQWTQGVTIPSLTTEFTKAGVIYELAGALARDQDKALADRRLSGLYNALITGNTAKPAAERVQIVFNAIQENIVAQLQEIDKTLEKMQTQRGEILKAVLSPA